MAKASDASLPSEPIAPTLTPSEPPQPHPKSVPRPLLFPPFIPINGLYNFRDCGGYPIAGHPNKAVRRGILYRSGEPFKITAAGIAVFTEADIAEGKQARG
ncbi:hypothetical protein C8A05DRAFT_36668, partial [Staphylotrichum tortipilum]